METARRITANFISLLAAELVSKLVLLLIFIQIARYLGPVDFGKFSFGVALAMIAVVLSDFGFGTLLVREISRDKKNVNKYVSHALLFKAILSIASIGAAIAYLAIFGYDYYTFWLSLILLIFFILQSFTDIFYAVFRAFERMQYDSLMKVIRILLLLFLVLLSIGKNMNMFFISMMFPVTEILIFFLSCAIYLKKFHSLRFEIDYGFLGSLARKSSLFFLSLVFTTLLLYVDAIMLERMKGTYEVGIYSAAYNLLLGVTFIPLMFSNAIYPVFSRYYLKDKSLLKFAYRKSFQYMLMFGLPITLGIFVYARNIMLFAYGQEYAGSILVVQILCWFILLRFINIISGTLLSSIDRQGARVFGQGSVAVINIILNILLIPRYGFLGAAIAVIASESLFLITYYYFIFREGLNFDYMGIAWKPLLASVIMTIPLLYINDLFIGTISGILIYFSTLIIVRAFNHEDKNLLNRIIRKG